jgi:hypothetical protein
VGPARQREKKKKRETAARAVAGDGDSGLMGLLGRKVSEVSFLLFFHFPNLFQFNSFQIKFKPKTFKLFTKFYRYFRIHTSNQKPCKAK